MRWVALVKKKVVWEIWGQSEFSSQKRFLSRIKWKVLQISQNGIFSLRSVWQNDKLHRNSAHKWNFLLLPEFSFSFTFLSAWKWKVGEKFHRQNGAKTGIIYDGPNMKVVRRGELFIYVLHTHRTHNVINTSYGYGVDSRTRFTFLDIKNAGFEHEASGWGKINKIQWFSSLQTTKETFSCLIQFLFSLTFAFSDHGHLSYSISHYTTDEKLWQFRDGSISAERGQNEASEICSVSLFFVWACNVSNTIWPFDAINLEICFPEEMRSFWEDLSETKIARD